MWPITVAARRSLLETFENLDGPQWETPSLCGSWTVREVLAHLILAAKPPARRYAAALVRARGSFDRANRDLAVADARRSVDDLLDAYRAVITHRFAPPGWPPAAPLGDILIHTLDVRVPLGIATDEPPEHFEPVMALLFSRMGTSFTSKGRPAVRWVATDRDWLHGAGPEVSGAMSDLALTAAGRSALVDRLAGAGVTELKAWLD